MTLTETQPDDTDTEGRAAQLRLALVCYGGVSLAIYMHGVTKELHYLVSASRAFDDLGVDGENPFVRKTDTRWAYFEALRDLSSDGRPVSVTVDIIAGTSAGGINGVCLAKVLARDGSQDALKQLWINEGDLKKLLNYAKVGGWRFRAAIAAGWTALGAGQARSPLRGDRMSRLLYSAIEQMEPADGPKSLIPPDGSLDLFVTTTDLDGFPVLVGTGWGGMSQRETNNAQVVEFHSSDPAAFGPDAVGALAFSARATSSFPGAFPPVSLDSFTHELQGKPFQPQKVAEHFRHRYDTGTTSSEAAWFVDGGVLDNAPFDLVVDAIADKRAESEVIRELIYIEPDPGGTLAVESPTAAAQTSAGGPGYLGALLKGVFTVKGSHSVLGELQRLRDTNIRISEIGDITRLQQDVVAHEIEQAWAGLSATTSGGPWSSTDRADVLALAQVLYRRVPGFVNAGYASYCRLKVDEVGRRLADEIAAHYEYPPDSARSSFVRAAITAWAHEQPQWRDADPTDLVDLLGPVDIPYRERRLLFVLAGINDLYSQVGHADGPSRAVLDGFKKRAWTMLQDLRSVPTAALGDLASENLLQFLGSDLTDAAVFLDPAAFAKEHRDQFRAVFGRYRQQLADALVDSSIPLWEEFTAAPGAPDAPWRRTLLARYLGFPLWDAVIFPTVTLGQLPQFSPIGVRQFSPLEAQALGKPAEGKLRGVSLHHFGGFTKASYRENDYLWGRLDAAELVLRTVRGAGRGGSATGVTDQPAAIAAAGPRLRPALEAVLAAESDLRRIDTKVWAFISYAVGLLPSPT